MTRLSNYFARSVPTASVTGGWLRTKLRDGKVPKLRQKPKKRAESQPSGARIVSLLSKSENSISFDQLPYLKGNLINCVTSIYYFKIIYSWAETRQKLQLFTKAIRLYLSSRIVSTKPIAIRVENMYLKPRRMLCLEITTNEVFGSIGWKRLSQYDFFILHIP